MTQLDIRFVVLFERDRMDMVSVTPTSDGETVAMDALTVASR